MRRLKAIEIANLQGLPEKTKRDLVDHLSSERYMRTGVIITLLGNDPNETLDRVEAYIKEKAGPQYQHLKPYVKWIILRYASKGIKRWEDVSSRTIPALLTYDRLKRTKKLKPDQRDVNRLKDLEGLEDLIDEYSDEDTSSGSERDKEIEQGFYDRREAEKIHDARNLKIVKLNTEKASCFFGRGTRWCTAATKGDNYFDDYKNDKTDGLYVFDFKQPGAKGKIQTTGNIG